jgi:hypothetical protein
MTLGHRSLNDVLVAHETLFVTVAAPQGWSIPAFCTSPLFRFGIDLLEIGWSRQDSTGFPS